MNELDEIIESMKMKGIFLMPDQDAAIRKLADSRMLRSALAMFDTSPFVMHNIIRTATQQFKLYAQTKTPVAAGGESRLTQDAQGPSTITPKPISLDELQRMLPDATKKATEFEKAPTWEPKIGDAIVVKLKRVIKGGYEQPLVVAGEFSGYINGRLGGSVKWAKKDVKGNVLEAGEIPTSTTVTQDLRLPTFAVSRAMEQDVALVEKFVYFLQLVGEKASQYPNAFKQVVVISLGQKFPA